MGNCLCGPKTPSTRVEPTTDQATLPCPNVSPPEETAENQKLVPLAEQEDIMLPHFHGPATLQVEGSPSSATDGSSLQITDWRSPSSFVNHIVKSESSSVTSHTSSVATDNSRPEYCLIVDNSTRVEPTTDQATLPCPNVSPPEETAENQKLVPLAEQEDIMLAHFHGPATLQVEGSPSSATDGSSLQITDWRSPSPFVNHIVKSESSSVTSHTSSVATDNSRPEYCLIVDNSTRVEPTTDQATLPCPNVSPPEETAENQKLVPLAEQEDIMLAHFHGPATLQVEGNPSSATDGSSLQITDWRSPSSFVNHIVKSESSSVISHTSSVATDNSRPEYCLIVGPFGREYSYKGYLPTIRKVVVSKHLGFDGVPLYHGPQRRRQFEVQMATLKKPGHPDLVKLIGVYFAEGHTVPLFELMPIGFYESYLHDYPQLQQELDWNTRVNIAVAAAKGLQSMHSEMICGDLRVMACDIFSFGMFLLELLTGLKPVKDKSSGLENLVDWAKDMLINNTNPVYMVDPFLFGEYPPEELHQILNLAQQCAQEDPSRQPALSELFGVLEEMSMKKDGFVYLSNDLVHESSMDGQPTKDGSEKSSDEDWEHLA